MRSVAFLLILQVLITIHDTVASMQIYDEFSVSLDKASPPKVS